MQKCSQLFLFFKIFIENTTIKKQQHLNRISKSSHKKTMKALSTFFIVAILSLLVAAASISANPLLNSFMKKASHTNGQHYPANKPHHHDDAANQQQQQTALDRYVSYTDPVFSWKRIPDTLSNNSQYSIATFELISQQWMTPQYSDRSIWKHNLVMIIPTVMNPKSDNAFIWITGDNLNKNGSIPNWEPKDMNFLDLLVTAEAAVSGECLGFILDSVPDQPICWPQPDGTQFCGSEDAAVGYSFEQFFLHNQSIEATLLFPMTKAAIAAMNASEQIAEQYLNIPVKKWIVSGASKRGWTTWLVSATLAYTNRIKASIPVVLDAINFADFLKREVQAYNQAISWVAAPYRVLAAFVNTTKYQEWASNVDPWYYRQRLTMPKFVINAAEDEFQQLDDQLHILPGLPGQTHNLVAYDCDHPLLPNIGLPLASIKAFAQSIAKDSVLPNYNWSLDETTGQLTVNTDVAPKEVSVYWATTPESSQGRRDFRGTVLKTDPCTIHFFGGCLRFIPWQKMDAVVNSATSFSTNVPTPAAGLFTGFLIQMKFPNVAPDGTVLADFIFSTPATVVPYNVFPSTGFCETQEACLNLPLV